MSVKLSEEVKALRALQRKQARELKKKKQREIKSAINAQKIRKKQKGA